MNVFSNVTEQDLINLRKLADQQRKQRDLKIRNRIWQQTHDKKLSESLSTITKKSEKVSDTTKKIGEVIEKSQSEKNYLNQRLNTQNVISQSKIRKV